MKKRYLFLFLFVYSLNADGQKNYRWMEHNSIHIGFGINKYMNLGYLHQNKNDLIRGIHLGIPLWQNYIGKKCNKIGDKSIFMKEGWTHPVYLTGFTGIPISQNIEIYGEIGIAIKRKYKCYVQNQEWIYSLHKSKIKPSYGIGFKTDFSEDLYLITNWNIFSGISICFGLIIN